MNEYNPNVQKTPLWFYNTNNTYTKVKFEAIPQHHPGSIHSPKERPKPVQEQISE